MLIQSSSPVYAPSQTIARLSHQRAYPDKKILDVYFYCRRNDQAALIELYGTRKLENGTTVPQVLATENPYVPYIFVVVWEEEEVDE